MNRAVLFLLTLALPGCATIIEGTTQDINVATNPPGASCAVERRGERLGVVAPTPGNLHLQKSGGDLMLTCAKDGFQTTSSTAPSRFVATTFLNFLIGGPIGFIVDGVSGADFRYPATVSLDLPPAGGTPTTSGMAPGSAPIRLQPAAPGV